MKTWLSAVHAALREVGGSVVSAPEAPTAGRNYARVSVRLPHDVSGWLLLNREVNMVAAAENPGAHQIFLSFVDVPAPDVFACRGYVVATPGDLDRPLSDDDVRALSPAEKRDVEYHKPERRGDLLFNWFD